MFTPADAIKCHMRLSCHGHTILLERMCNARDRMPAAIAPVSSWQHASRSLPRRLLTLCPEVASVQNNVFELLSKLTPEKYPVFVTVGTAAGLVGVMKKCPSEPFIQLNGSAILLKMIPHTPASVPVSPCVLCFHAAFLLLRKPCLLSSKALNAAGVTDVLLSNLSGSSLPANRGKFKPEDDVKLVTYSYQVRFFCFNIIVMPSADSVLAWLCPFLHLMYDSLAVWCSCCLKC